ncbi:DUF885 domain-containing protein [Paraferrimonas sedimenticola]|uniref:DUF885 domain-containing protein n=1 Tax=Paraferrimonas sedimenticola TaxID=375674 RepID=A0AA37RVB9_9GAMM|nr:DUF885 domain-containing protein [Paraferrimonas sedimenticola]GLP95733.1 hypothetical protein GCM10007895_10390 [Paraferrimonas sedimenticola]
MRLSLIAMACSALLVAAPAVHAEPPQDPSTQAAVVSASKHLNQLFMDYQEEMLQLNPIVATIRGDMRFNDQFGDWDSEENDKAQQALNTKYLNKIRAIDPKTLSGQDRVSYDIFLYDRETAEQNRKLGVAEIQGLMPLTQFGGWPMYLPQMSDGMLGQPFNTVEDYDNWIKRVSGFAPYVDRVIAKMRKGAEQGVVLPTILAEKLLPQVQAFVGLTPQKSPFWGPIKKLPDSFSKPDQARIIFEYEQQIKQGVIPAFERLATFIETEYMPKTRKSHGIDGIPKGKLVYQQAIKQFTTTDLSAEEIHQMGLKEADRLFEEMKKVKAKTGFKGDMKAFFEYLKTDPKFYYTKAEDLLQGYEDLRAVVDPKLDKIFNVEPKAPYIIKAVEPFREKSMAPAQYFRGSPDGKRPGVFYANTYDLKARPKWFMEALSLHEASPGHHFQVSLNQEAGNLPPFRRYGGYGAYVEGWGLYAEVLGLEMGMYTDPYQYFGMLYAQIWRANRLVVDTGLHAKGWTREQAIEFMQSNSPISDADVVAEVERYMAMPGQALGYMIGRMTLQEIRAKAEAKLGGKFDLREFHRQVLIDGAMPLTILEAKINRWVESQQG